MSMIGTHSKFALNSGRYSSHPIVSHPFLWNRAKKLTIVTIPTGSCKLNLGDGTRLVRKIKNTDVIAIG